MNWFSLLWVVALNLIFAAGQDLATYQNLRFGFKILYPKSLIAELPPQNGDGQAWKSSDETVKLRAWGMHVLASPRADLEQQFSWTQTKYQITYQRKTETYFVISGFEPDGSIFYCRTQLAKDRRGAPYWVTMELVYPASKKQEYDQLIPRMFNDIKGH